ncbi:MAG: TonB-dependent receptor [Bryobacteraceae bacterium]|jgi:iron complex outermembrane receptor protein
MTPIFFLLIILSSLINAQSGASVAGVVKDPQGQPVPGATLTLSSHTGAAGSATTSDSSGSYRFEGLPEGDYLLRAAAPGFALFLSEDIHLRAGAVDTREVALQLAGVHEELVVTASGTPQLPEQVSKATTVIDQADADARDVAALSDVVALTPGVRVQQLGGPGAFTTIQMRGLRDQDTAVLVDGLRLRDASATQGDATGLIEDLLFTDANRVEVMRGSGSSLYGTNAIGGVINVITDEGGGRTRGSLLADGGSLGAFRGRGQLSGGFRKDKIQYSLGVSETDVTNGVGGDAPFRNTSLQSRVTFHLSPSIRLIARVYGGDSFSKVPGEPDIIGTPSGFGIINAIPLSPSLLTLYQNGVPLSQMNTGNATFIPGPDDPDSTRDARFVSAALILNGQASPALDYSLSYQILSDGRRYGNGPAGLGYQPDGSTRSLYDGRIQTADAQIHYRLGFNLLSGGYEFESENYANDNTDQSNSAVANAASVTQRSNSVFVQDQAQFFGDRLQVSGAFRAQFFALNTPVFSPLASAPYQRIAFPSPTPAYTGDSSVAYFFRKTGTKLRAHIGRGYRAPSLYERFGAGFDPVFGYSVYGDPRLKPEHSLGLDGGIDQTFFRGRVKTSASYFYTWLQDVINFDTSGLINPATDPFGRFIGYLNTQGGISRGVELSAAVAPTRSLRVTTAYTYVNAIERTPIVGDVLQTFVVPRKQFSVLMTEQPTSRLMLSFDTLASSSYLTPMYGDVVTQTYRFGGIHKVNLGASYRIPLKEYQAIRFFVRANNIFKQTYFENGFLTPERTAMGGVQFEF